MGFRFLAGVCMVMASALACAAPAAAIRVAAQLAAEPKFIVETRRGVTRNTGFCVDILEAVEKRDPSLHFVYQPGPLPLTRIQSEMATGQLDVNCMIANAERRSKFRVIPIKLFSYNYHLIVRSDDDVTVNHWDDVRKLGERGRVLVVKGTGALPRLEQAGGLLLDSGGSTPEVNLRKLLAGRARFFYYRAEGWKHAMARTGLQDKVKVLPAVMGVEDFYLTFGQHVPAKVAAAAAKALAEVDESGELERIRKRWMNN